jgi:DNA polymerase I
VSDRLFLLDGSALTYRAFFALQEAGLTNARGEPTSAVLGFANTLHLLVREEHPEYLAVVFDAPGPTFRHEAYAEYKAHREAMPDDLRVQMPWVRELVRAWPCALIEVPGVEADDVIGSYAVQVAGPELEVVMVTGDKDFYQLLGEHVRILNPGRGGAAAVEARVLGPEDLPERFLVTRPRQVVDVLALMGDASDNVPGVPGVGQKTAGKLIAEYGDLETLYARLEALPPGLRKKLTEYRDSVFRARELVTIRSDLDLPVPLEELRSNPPGGEPLRLFLDRMGFTRLRRDLGLNDAPPDLELFARQDQYTLVSDRPALERLVERLAQSPSGFSVETEATLPDPMRAELLGIGISPARGEAYYVPFRHREEEPAQESRVVRSLLGPLLDDPRLPKTMHDAKYDLLVLERAGLSVSGLDFDTLVAAYLVDPEGSHRLDDLARDRLGETMAPRGDVLGRGGRQRVPAEASASLIARHAAEHADMTLRLRAAIAPQLEELELAALFRDVEMPLLFVLRDMERTGVALDLSVLESMSVRLARDLERLEDACRRAADGAFNVNSPSQLAQVLFDRLGLPRGKRTKTGYSTDSEVLEGLRPLHALPGLVLEYRQMAKVKSTYVDTLPAIRHPETGRVHARFNQTVAATGRLSSSDPNLQNIPVRTELGREVRRAFVPGEPGWVLVSADYSQIELRIMAHLSRDPVLVDAFRRDLDVHRDTAARLFGVAPEAVTDAQRGLAKTVNFGILYGQGAYGLARTLGISASDAAAFIQSYKLQYAGVMGYLDRTLVQARRSGFVTTLLHRRRLLPALKFKSAAARAAAERLAINTPIQGSAADLIKVAMVHLHRRLREDRLAARLLLQVHDELVLECPNKEADAVSALVRETMEGALTLEVPIVVNVGVGPNWAEIH